MNTPLIRGAYIIYDSYLQILYYYLFLRSYSFPSFPGIPQEGGFTLLRLSLAPTNDASFQHIAKCEY